MKDPVQMALQLDINALQLRMVAIEKLVHSSLKPYKRDLIDHEEAEWLAYHLEYACESEGWEMAADFRPWLAGQLVEASESYRCWVEDNEHKAAMRRGMPSPWLKRIS